jgi:hypothetical protein
MRVMGAFRRICPLPMMDRAGDEETGDEQAGDEELGDGPSKMLYAMATYHTSASCHISMSLSSIIT